MHGDIKENDGHCGLNRQSIPGLRFKACFHSDLEHIQYYCCIS